MNMISLQLNQEQTAMIRNLATHYGKTEQKILDETFKMINKITHCDGEICESESDEFFFFMLHPEEEN